MGKIIFGNGAVGMALFDKCLEEHINVLGYCDNDRSKNVLSVEEAKALGAEFMIATGNVEGVSAQLKGCKVAYEETALLLESIDLSKHDRYTQFCILNCIEANRNHGNPYFLRSLDVMITEKCSLRCKDCSNLMQYYSNPKDIDISGEIEKLLEDYTVSEFRIIGGEPFLNRKWESIVQNLADNPKVKRIVIYTNGTVIPKANVLANNKIFVLISDYGKLSFNIGEVKKLFDAQGISYKVIAPRWTECGTIKKHDRNFEDNERIFNECCSRNTTLSNGKLYDCAFSANLARLGICDSPASCDYCNGRSLNDAEITPAIQMER